MHRIVLPLTKCSRRIRTTVSTMNSSAPSSDGAAAWQARVSWRVDIGLTGSRPGNSQASTSSALRPSDPVPVAQKVEQHRGEHRLAILAALALLDAQHHPLRVDIGDLERNDLGDAQSGAIGDAQRRLVFDAWRRLQKTSHLLGA